MSRRPVPPPPTRFGPAAASGMIQAKRPVRLMPPPPPAVARWTPASAPGATGGRTASGAALQPKSGPNAPAVRPSRLQPPPPPFRPAVVQRSNLDFMDQSDDSDDEADDDEDEREEVTSVEWGDTGLVLRGGKQAGWALKSEQNFVRESRSYAGERDRQLLRQFSAQLFFLAKSKVQNAQEIQTMAANGNLFVAANDDADIQAIYDELQNDLAKNLKTALTKSWGSDRSGAYWAKLRSTKKKSTTRFGNKFKKLYDTTRENKLQSGQVAIDPRIIWAVIKDAKVEQLNGGKKSDVVKALGGSGKIFLLYAGDDGRHAEEKLMDLLESVDHKGLVLIAGKKRPCKTCLGRLRYMVDQGYQVKHSKYPGFIWKERFEAQPEEVKKFTVEVIKEGKSYVTIRSKNKKRKEYDNFPQTYSEKPDFASDSDSDED